MFEIGMLGGLAAKNDVSGQIDDMKYLQQAHAQKQAMDMQKAKMFADDLEFQQGSNPFDAAEIQKENRALVDNLGKYTRENQDWAWNPDKAAQVKFMKQQFKSSPAVLRSMAYKEAEAQYNKDLTEALKNPLMHDMDALAERGKEFENYRNFGHTGGAEFAAKEGAKPIVYQSPEAFRDLNGIFEQVGGGFKDVKQETIHGAGRGAYQEYADQASLDAVAKQVYIQNKRQIDQNARQQGITDPLEYIKNGIDSYIPKKRYEGDYNLQDALTLEGVRNRNKQGSAVPPQPTTWDTEIRDKQAGKDNGETFRNVFGPRPNVPIMTNSNKKVIISGKDVEYTGEHRYIEVNGKKQKQVEVNIDIPREEANASGYTYDPWGYGDFKVEPDWEGKVTTHKVTGGDGKIHDMARIKTWMPVDVNSDANRGRYNKVTMATKYQQGAQEGSPDYSGWTQDSKGNVFDEHGNNRGTVNNYK